MTQGLPLFFATVIFCLFFFAAAATEAVKGERSGGVGGRLYNNMKNESGNNNFHFKTQHTNTKHVF